MSEPVQYEFTPMGVVRSGTSVPFTGETVMAAGAALEAAKPEFIEPKPAPKPLKAFAPGVSTLAVSPTNVLRATRLRVQEIRQELKRMRALQKELAQLENILTAAKKPRHLAEVRQLSNRK